MTTTQQSITPEQRRQLEELYRQQVSAVRTLAHLLGYPCPIANRAERRGAGVQNIDTCDTLEEITVAVWSSGSSSGS